MDRIASFSVDHRKIKPCVYISRIDGDITTYDMRMRKPNTGDLLSNSALHSLEHMFATLIRNSGNQRRRYIFWAYGLPNRILSAY